MSKFSDIVRTKRKSLYKTPKAFHREADLACTYFAYTKIEKGLQHPSRKLAIEIIRKLDLDERSALLAWAFTLMPDDDSKSVFSEGASSNGRDFGDLQSPDGQLLSRAQVKHLIGKGIHIDILRYLSLRIDLNGETTKNLAKIFKIELQRTRNLLEGLEEHGLIEKFGSDRYRMTRLIKLPDTPEAHAVLEIMAQRTYRQLSSARQPPAASLIFTRRLSDAQFSDLKERLQDVIAAAAAYPTPSDTDKTYAIGAFIAEPNWDAQ